ncbi:Ni/Co efflux regulator RcnB [Bradyrhizobium sp. LM3.6]
MTKLSGTSGQVFSGLAESLSMRGTSRAGKSAGAKAQADTSFNDLLHTVSNLAKRALNDEGSDTAVKAGTLRTRLAHQSEKDKAKDDTVHEGPAAAEDPGFTARPTEKSSDKKTDKSSGKHVPVDHTGQADVQNQSSIAVIVGQEIAAGPVVQPQMQAPAGDKNDASGRDGRSATTKREVQAMGMSKTMTADPGPSAVAPIAAHSQAAAPHATAAAQATSTQDGEPSPKATAPDFEAVAANVERAAKASARDALPETTKVTVVQQETHLPPAQFNAPQQGCQCRRRRAEGISGADGVRSSRSCSVPSQCAGPAAQDPDHQPRTAYSRERHRAPSSRWERGVRPPRRRAQGYEPDA